jgi:hypothetical protein
MDDLVTRMPNPHDHPLDAFVVHCLQYDTPKSTGKRPSMSEMVGASYASVIDEALTRAVEGKLADFSIWED